MMARFFATFFIAALFIVGAPTSALAHALVPQALVDYVREHPDATPAEIKAFADQATPEYSATYQNGAKILALARDQDTSLLDTLIDFFKLGVGHILSGPDHILFVLSLLLVFASVGEILTLVSCFTVAHSTTLALSALGILVVSPRVTEPLIALSIAYVALTSVFLGRVAFFKSRYSKPASVFFFGLFHGLGFAGLLREIQIPADKFIPSLFSFNLGIELGQLIIIACALPLIYLCRNKPWYPLIIQVIAVVIAFLAFVWVVQRVFYPG